MEALLIVGAGGFGREAAEAVAVEVDGVALPEPAALVLLLGALIGVGASAVGLRRFLDV